MNSGHKRHARRSKIRNAPTAGRPSNDNRQARRVVDCAFRARLFAVESRHGFALRLCLDRRGHVFRPRCEPLSWERFHLDDLVRSIGQRILGRKCSAPFGPAVPVVEIVWLLDRRRKINQLFLFRQRCLDLMEREPKS